MRYEPINPAGCGCFAPHTACADSCRRMAVARVNRLLAMIWGTPNMPDTGLGWRVLADEIHAFASQVEKREDEAFVRRNPLL